MEDDRIARLADALLVTAKENHLLFTTWNSGRACNFLQPKGTSSEVKVATQLLLSHNLATETAEKDSFRLSSSGIAQAGRLKDFLKVQSAKEEAVFAADLATIDSVSISKEQVRLATEEARKARRAMIWSTIAAIASAVMAVLSWLFPRSA